MAAPLVVLLRPRQWYKNALVLVPLVFSGHAADGPLWLRALVAFAAFCALSSSAYCANDILDAPRDRNHPTKRDRPVAAGTVTTRAALALALALAATGLLLLAALGTLTLLLGALYLALQAVYNLWLKHVLLWDAMAVALGFVVRALAGTTAIDVGRPTEWLIVCTFLLALYLALAKRRHELAGPGAQTRPALAHYTPAFTQNAMHTAATLLLAAYTMYTFFGATAPDGSHWMMFTLPFAIYGVLRHAWLAERNTVGDDAEVILKDRATLANAAAWGFVVLCVEAGLPQALLAWVAAP